MNSAILAATRLANLNLTLLESLRVGWLQFPTEAVPSRIQEYYTSTSTGQK